MPTGEKLGCRVQVTNILEFGMEPYEASAAPRFWPLRDNFTPKIESRGLPGWRMAWRGCGCHEASEDARFSYRLVPNFLARFQDRIAECEVPIPDGAVKRTESGDTFCRVFIAATMSD
jgi:hypothetical protein